MLKFYIEKEPIFGRNYKIYLRRQVGNNFAYAQEVQMKVMEDNGDQVFPMCTLDPESCQQLMDQLWHVGFRPSEGTGSAGSLAATQKHLEDMRKLVFQHYGLDDVESPQKKGEK